MDRRVQVWRATLADDGFTQAETWAALGSPLWAAVTPISDGERFRAGAVGAHVTARVRLRYSAFAAAITAQDRLVCEGRTYEIVAPPKEIGRREGIEITCSARADT